MMVIVFVSIATCFPFSKDAENLSELCDRIFTLGYYSGIHRQFDIVI